LHQIKAVIFDIASVVLKSPLLAIAAYEQELGLPSNYLNCMITERGPQGAWQKFERGEIQLFDFYEAFSHELSDVQAGNEWYTHYCDRKGIEYPPLPKSLSINGREFFGRMMRESQQYDPHVREAILKIREAGRHKVIALTNNYSRAGIHPSELAFLGWDANGVVPHHIKELFNDFCDSSVLGMRKPEPEFYLTACRRNNVKPDEVVFLDDLGINLKAARELGMRTIRVPIGESQRAIAELGVMLSLDLTGSGMDVATKL